MSFHVNPTTGNASRCRAQKGKCPFGSSSEHYSSKELAAKAWEGKQATPLAGTKKRLILSDIDGTLVRSSLVLENAVALHDEGLIDLGDIPARWRNDMKNEAIIRELAEAYREILVGKKVSFTRAKESVERMLSKDENFYSAMDRLIQYKKEGGEVVLISGSPDYLVRPFAQHFGFKYRASKYHRDAKGNFTGEITLMAGSAAKEKEVKKLKPEQYDEVVGLGDTASDAPLLAAAHESILVSPTEETIKNLKEQNIRVDEIITD